MGRVLPPRVVTDEIRPAFFFDGTKSLRNEIMRWVFCFDDVLDADKLHISLTKLLEREDWRRLGGRWRFNEQKKLEVHVPKTFDPKRPAIRFSHDSFDVDIDEHPLGKRIANMTHPANGPSVRGSTGIVRELGYQDSIPKTLDDYVNNDEPLIALHVATFRDATILAVNCSHAVADVVGLSTLINNWCKVLAGREEEVQPLENHDVLTRVRPVNEQDEEEYTMMSNVIAGFSLFLFSLGFIWDMFFGLKMEDKLLFVPGSWVKDLKQRAMDDLGTKRQAETGDQTANNSFVSEGDILFAWCCKMMAHGLGQQCTRSVSVNFAFELRSRLQNVFNSSTAYVQNAFLGINAVFTAQDLRALPMGQVALRLRSSLAQQSTEPQVRAQLREQIRSITESGKKTIHGTSDSVLFSFSNWTKAGLFETIDFSPAVVKAGRRPEERVSEVGKPVALFPISGDSKPNLAHRHIMVILGKDRGGNYWFQGELPHATWAKIEEDFKTM